MSLRMLVKKAATFYRREGLWPTASMVISYLAWRMRATVFELRNFRSIDTVGSGLKIRGSEVIVRASDGGSITIGNSVEFVGDLGRSTFFKVSGELDVGDEVFINRGCEIYATDRVVLGYDATLAPNVVVRDSDMHAVGDGQAKNGPVKVGAHAWIGTESIILKGVTIGEGAVVGAGSVVTDDVPPYTVVASESADRIADVE